MIRLSYGRMSALAIGLWYVCAVAPLPFLTRSLVTGNTDAGTNIKFLIIAIVALLIVDFLTLKRLVGLIQKPDMATVWLGIIVSAIGVVSVLTARIEALGYACLLAFYCLNARLLWTMDQRSRLLAFRVISIATTGCLLVMFALHGFPVGRWLGGLHPNLTGAVCLAAAISSLLGWGRRGWVIFLFAFSVAVLVSSRYTLLALAVFAILALIGKPGRSRQQQVAGFGIILFVVLLVLLLFPDSIANLFLLGDSDRGIGSGMTGRTELYGLFMPQFQGATFLGYGFRMREAYQGVHSGPLNLYLENGLFIGTAFLLFVIWRLFRGLHGLMLSDRTSETVYLGAGITALVLGSIFQPQLINFGDPMGAMLLLLLMAPTATRSRRTSVRRRAPRRQLAVGASL